jgi:TRAP-type C4-dicarboxylate transport system permease small subunit
MRVAAGRVLRAINERLATATKAVVVVAVVVMLASLAAQVVMRYLFGLALSWSEELALLLFSWVILLVTALGVREGFHVRMDLVAGHLPPAPRSALAHAIHVAVLAAGVFLGWQGWRYFVETRGTVSAAIAYPIELLHLAAPVGGLLIAVFALERLVDPLPPAPGER